ncbi:hypothetical protein IMG5_137960 [Ichthyophthirius multifiliis]|uniref:THIF-type NAD/FAD binding fold domain-containing protein n=1 Tax=Ichthyophthirius multifiliis TaxID=5932 RepID=G0QX50_ICHMU|nr:hypothetical protein IMG5_137960 [Ichthyophthirius multifiliis]EGR30207.1 hypothetical protein IMG5_137960 [Ichthyophthirius multifiliis]|eukprot:XP_004031803.1 hypothetical protein IMG5_137960 [Ichthyophthirius multifiliis]
MQVEALVKLKYTIIGVSLTILSHAFATQGDVGHSKVQQDYVVDCIDNIDAKVALLAYCKNNNKKVISSMGAGMKSDPTRVQIRDISETTYDDLSRAVRIKLKKLGITNGIKVVLSVEKSSKELLPLQRHQEDKPDEFKVFSNYRLRIVPVLGTMPAIFGLALSSYILCDLAGQLYQPYLIDDGNLLLARWNPEGEFEGDFQKS